MSLSFGIAIDFRKKTNFSCTEKKSTVKRISEVLSESIMLSHVAICFKIFNVYFSKKKKFLMCVKDKKFYCCVHI